MFLPQHTKCFSWARVTLSPARFVYWNLTVAGDLEDATAEVNEHGKEFQGGISDDTSLADIEAKGQAALAAMKVAYNKFASLDLFFTTKQEVKDLADGKLWPIIQDWERIINDRVEKVRQKEASIRQEAEALVANAAANEKRDANNETVASSLQRCESNVTKAFNLAITICNGLLNYNYNPPNPDQLNVFFTAREDSFSSLVPLIQPAIDMTRSPIVGFEERGAALSARATSLKAAVGGLQEAASNYRDGVIRAGKITDAAKTPFQGAMAAFKKQNQGVDGRVASR